MGLNQLPSLPDKFDPFLYPPPPSSSSSSSPNSRDTTNPNPHPSPNPNNDQDQNQDQDPNAHKNYYLQHCLPTIPQIVSKLHTLRLQHPSLRRVYVLSNGWGWWLNGLKGALQEDGWDDMKSTVELRLDDEQEYVGMAVDMAIAEKAEVFVGNGVRFFLLFFSSFFLFSSFLLVRGN
jgi:hypothetical protein